jgi:hypothetical protein
MSAKHIRSLVPLGNSVNVSGREAALKLSAEQVAIHKNGIEFHSPTSFKEWSEMTVTLHSPLQAAKLSCHGIVVGCVGTRHSGYNISMLFTSLTTQAEKELGAMARSKWGAG